MASNRAQLEKKVAELTTKSNLNKQVVQSLVDHYQVKCREKGLDRDCVRDDLMNYFDILDDFLLDRIYRTFDISCNTQYLKMDDWVLGMAVFLSGLMEEKTKFCFSVFDLNGDGYISREEMFQFLKPCMVTKFHDADQDDADEGIKELTELVLKKLDLDHDGRVSYIDFQKAVKTDCLLLESLGQCLPNEKSRRHFLQILGDPDMNDQPTTMSSKSRKSAKTKRPKCEEQRQSHGQQKKEQRQSHGQQKKA